MTLLVHNLAKTCIKDVIRLGFLQNSIQKLQTLVKRSNPQNPKHKSKSSTKRKSRQEVKEDRALVKKLKEDNTIAVRIESTDGVSYVR